jgi:hypothetical protein
MLISVIADFTPQALGNFGRWGLIRFIEIVDIYGFGNCHYHLMRHAEPVEASWSMLNTSLLMLTFLSINYDK